MGYTFQDERGVQMEMAIKHKDFIEDDAEEGGKQG